MKNNNKTKWMIGLGAVIVLAVGAYAAFSGPIGDQLTGALSLRNREAAIARVKPQPVASAPARKLAQCNKDLADSNMCLNILQHLSVDDLTPWMNSSGIQSSEIDKCLSKVGSSSWVRLSNPL